MKLRLATVGLTLAVISSASAAYAQSADGVCHTTSRAPHSIEQHCDDGEVQEVFLDQPGKVVIQDFQGQATYPPARQTVGEYVGPWLVWTDYNGNTCATSAAISGQNDFYPIICPPSGVPSVD